MSTQIFGSGIRRREDPRLITGTATYTDDFTLPGMVHAAMLRSPHAHARIMQHRRRARAGRRRASWRSITGKDSTRAQAGAVSRGSLPECGPQDRALPSARDRDVVRYVGDVVAVVVAETPLSGVRRAGARSTSTTSRLPSVIDPEKRSKPGAPQLHADVPNNEAFHWTVAGRRRRRGVQERRGRRQGTDRPAAPDPDRHGAASGARPVERRHRAS